MYIFVHLLHNVYKPTKLSEGDVTESCTKIIYNDTILIFFSCYWSHISVTLSGFFTTQDLIKYI